MKENIDTVDRQVAGIGRDPFKKLIKKSPAKVSGLMLDPLDHSRVAEYLLEGDPNDPDVDMDAITLEFYDNEEWVFFLKKNKVLIEAGYLMEYEGTEPELDTRNILTDEQITDALSKPFLALRSLLAKLDSQVTVRRVLDSALSLDCSVAYVDAIKRRLAELEEKSLPPKMPERIVSEL